MPPIDPAIEAQYNLRERHPDYGDHFARYAEWSAATRRRRDDAALDLDYGAGAGATIDVFPAPRAGAPFNLFIHGGYWRSLDKSDFSFVADGLGADGAAVAVVNYALAPAVTLDAIALQIRAATAWCRDNARRFNADPARLHLSGHSAGGHLVAMALATTGADGVGPISSGAAISGLFDLEPLRHSSVNADLGLDAPAARRNSPIHAPPAPPLPMIVAVGGDESDAFIDQSRAYAALCRDHGCPLLHQVPAGLNHFQIIEALADRRDPLTAAILDRMAPDGMAG